MSESSKPTSEQLGVKPAHDLIDAPSAAAAGLSPCPPDEPDCPQPITAWTTPEDSAALADGLRMKENPAEWAFVRLSRLIQDFEAKLDENHEIGATIVNGPGDGAFHMRDVGFWGPDLILFMGVNEHGKPIRLIQHYTQLNVMLTAMPKPVPAEPPRRIGFQLQERLEQVGAQPPAAPPGS